MRFELGFDVARRCHVAVGQVAEVELHGRLVAPLKRHLIDPPRGLAARLQSMVHGGEVVIRRIEMGAIVRADDATLDGRIFTPGQLGHADPHVFCNRRGGLMVVEVLDLRQGVLRIALYSGLERRGDVDQTTPAWRFSLPKRLGALRAADRPSRWRADMAISKNRQFGECPAP
jgi:hypothetical protein